MAKLMETAARRSRPRALVADNNERYRRSVCSALKALGWHARAVDANVDSLAARRGRYDLVVATIRMPSLGGRAMLAELGRWPSRTGVVAVGEPGTRELVLPALGGRARRFLSSPFGRDGLRAAVGHVCTPAVEETPPRTRTVIDVAALARQLREDGSSLPTIAPIALEVQRLIGTPECGVDEVLEVVEKDPAIAAAILKLANSSRYSPPSPIKTLRTACLRLGNGRILALASEALLRDLFALGSGPVQQMTAALWRHTVVKATGARAVAARVGSSRPDELQVAVMLCDLGELALLQMAARAHSGVDWSCESLQRSFARGVHEHHELVSSLLLRSWQLEPSLVELARHHHKARGARRRDVERRRHIMLAAWAGALRAGFHWLEGQATPDVSASLHALRLDEEDLDDLFADAANWVEQD